MDANLKMIALIESFVLNENKSHYQSHQYKRDHEYKFDWQTASLAQSHGYYWEDQSRCVRINHDGIALFELSHILNTHS